MSRTMLLIHFSIQSAIILQSCVSQNRRSKVPWFYRDFMTDFKAYYGTDYDPTHGYEPYWTDGEWVLKDKKLPPGVTTTKIPQVCGEECNYLYTSIGEVCGRQTDDYTYEKYNCGWFTCDWGYILNFNGFRTFRTYCQFLDHQCRAPFDKSWIFVHKGPCIKNMTEDFWPMKFAKYPVSRMEYYFTRLVKSFRNHSIDPPELPKKPKL